MTPTASRVLDVPTYAVGRGGEAKIFNPSCKSTDPHDLLSIGESVEAVQPASAVNAPTILSKSPAPVTSGFTPTVDEAQLVNAVNTSHILKNLLAPGTPGLPFTVDKVQPVNAVNTRPILSKWLTPARASSFCVFQPVSSKSWCVVTASGPTSGCQLVAAGTSSHSRFL
jgi:hypothetical protein